MLNIGSIVWETLVSWIHATISEKVVCDVKDQNFSLGYVDGCDQLGWPHEND